MTRGLAAAIVAALTAGCGLTDPSTEVSVLPDVAPSDGGTGAGQPDAGSAGEVLQDAGRLSPDSGQPASQDAGAAPTPECSDGIDNDGDGLVDWQYDLGCANGDDDEAAAPRDQEGGFTTFDPSPASRIVYVSSSTGDDGRDGTSPALAVKTLARAAGLVRDGQHDFMLLRRGDTWRESLGAFKSGKDATHPLVVASYGESTARPRVEVATHFINHGGKARSFLALVGLEIVSYKKIPEAPDFDGATGGGLRFVGGGRSLLVEDCHFQYGEIVLQSFGTEHYEDLALRRNVIELSYHVDTCGQNQEFRPSGVYASHVTGLTLEENVFDHNGWNEDVPSACATMFNHNMYLNAHRLVVRDNVVARASSMGIKMRSDVTDGADELLFENNLLVDGEIGIGIGGNTSEPRRFTDTVIRRNVFTQIGMGNASGRNFAWMLEVTGNVNTRVEDNHFLHQPWFDNAYAITLASDALADIHVARNLFYDLRKRALNVKVGPAWSNVTVSDNTFVDPSHGSCLVEHQGSFTEVKYEGNAYSSGKGSDWFCIDGSRKTLAEWKTGSGETGASTWTGTFTDPDRTVGSYAATLGLEGTLEAYLGEAKKQSRFNWKGNLTAAAVNDYIRAGFE